MVAHGALGPNWSVMVVHDDSPWVPVVVYDDGAGAARAVNNHSLFVMIAIGVMDMVRLLMHHRLGMRV